MPYNENGSIDAAIYGDENQVHDQSNDLYQNQAVQQRIDVPGAPVQEPAPIPVSAPGIVSEAAPAPGVVQEAAPAPGVVQEPVPAPGNVSEPAPAPVSVSPDLSGSYNNGKKVKKVRKIAKFIRKADNKAVNIARTINSVKANRPRLAERLQKKLAKIRNRIEKSLAKLKKRVPTDVFEKIASRIKINNPATDLNAKPKPYRRLSNLARAKKLAKFAARIGRKGRKILVRKFKRCAKRCCKRCVRRCLKKSMRSIRRRSRRRGRRGGRRGYGRNRRNGGRGKLRLKLDLRTYANKQLASII
ncbi:hypothetical protein AYI70_g10747 [Smittium culicis]|uniref:Uncharacterized protein n=1 Tax=Smittium culicis TaxID=133412 RepID=A0A1R1X540_9FUNG|nr:hypothetical protein AYI70_g10747 [Smittium culicis]